MFSYIFSENFSLKRITSKIHFSNNKLMNNNIDKTKMFQEFENDIYPFRLVVGHIDDIDSLNQLYESIDREELKPHKDAKATTYPAYDKSTNDAAVVVLFTFKPSIRTITHESLHVTQMVMSNICQTELNSYTEECYSYLIGWVSEKLEQYENNMKKNANDM